MASNSDLAEDDGIKKALLIGVSDYKDKNLKPLPFCENDAKKIYELLISSKLGFEISEDNKMIGEVNARNMKKAIKDFFQHRGTQAQDILLFYSAGHCVADNSGQVFMASSEIDSTYPSIGGFLFQDLAKLTNASYSTRTITILDYCHSASFDPTGRRDPNDAAKTTYRKIDDESNVLRQWRGRCLLAACESYKRANEIKREKYSIFTYYLLEGLRGKPQSIDNYGNVTVDRLANYVYDTISSLPPDKKPNQMPIRNVEGGARIILGHYPDLVKRQLTPQTDYLLQLLRDEKIDEFNEICETDHHDNNSSTLSEMPRKNNNYSRLDLYNVDLGGRNLSHANLRNAD
jgi:uncharacterized caspase-like protein